jgi:CTP:molybdopterin cytidylyltransferase MocA
MTRLAAIVLAAGRSSRMGELKPLLPLGDATVLARAVGAFAEAGVADVRVVVGWRGDEVAAAAAALGAAVVVNDGWERGMFSSVAAGVAGLDADVDAFFLLPTDCALVRAETIGRLARAARVHPAPVVYPVRDGRRGHPPLIARTALPAGLGGTPQDEPDRELQDERGRVSQGEPAPTTDEARKAPAGGLRGLLAAHDASALEIAVDDRGILLDMDTPADYRRACDDVAGESLPDAARCLELLRDARVPSQVVAHSRAVALVAVALTARLNRCEAHLSARLVEAAALLHDIARAGPDHAAAGARLLSDLGYRRVAAVTALHMDPQDEVETCMQILPNEAQILYLADKLVADTSVVTLDARLAARLSDLRAESEGAAHARARLERALELSRTVERLIGEPTEALARRALAAEGGSAATTGSAAVGDGAATVSA